jgi:hypothetical protein
MTDMTGQSLSRAYELIEADQLREARAILEPLIETDRDNPDVWWLYAHAVDDADDARVALTNVLRLAPEYPGAGALMNDLERVYGTAAVPRSASADDRLEEDEFDLDLEEGTVTETDASANQRRAVILRLLLVAATVVLIIVAFLVLRPFLVADEPEEDPTPTAEELVEEPTFAPGIGLLPEETDEPDLIEIELDNGLEPQVVTTIIDALDGFELARGVGEFRDTNLGETLLFAVCSERGEGLRGTLAEIMPILAENALSVVDDIDAIGVELVDCDTDTVINVIAVNLEDAIAFSGGELTDTEFRSRWLAAG